MGSSEQQKWIELDSECLKDAQFTELAGADEFGFVESCGINRDFDILRGDGKELIYLPVQLKDLRLTIVSIDMKAPGDGAEEVMKVPDINHRESLSGFGCDLTGDGILWVCVFNLNLIAGICLPLKGVREGSVIHKIPNIPAPNDVCYSADEKVLYVASGTFFNNALVSNCRWFCWQNKAAKISNSAIAAPAYGQVYKIDIEKVWCTYLNYKISTLTQTLTLTLTLQKG